MLVTCEQRCQMLVSIRLTTNRNPQNGSIECYSNKFILTFNICIDGRKFLSHGIALNYWMYGLNAVCTMHCMPSIGQKYLAPNRLIRTHKFTFANLLSSILIIITRMMNEYLCFIQFNLIPNTKWIWEK